jgi:hypothetical protein
MVSVNTSQPDFSAGEIAPKFYGRHDLQITYKGARRVRNFIVEAAGGVFFRPGFYYAAQTKNNQPAWLYKFRFIDSASFTLEFTQNAIRFYRNNGQVRFAAQNITGITQANPAVVTYSGADTFANGDSVLLGNISGMTNLNDNEYIVANVNVGANTFELAGVNSTAFPAYTSGGTIEKVMEIVTTYATADLEALKFAQEKNALYIAHPLYPPKKLTYTSPTSWTFADHSPIRKTRQNAQVISAVTLANPAVLTYTGSDSFTNGDTVFINSATGMTEINEREFTIAAVNTGANTFQLVGLDSSGYAAYTGGGIVRKVSSAAAPFLSAGTYPGAVGFYDRRLFYGGSTNEPNTLFVSNAGNLDDFTLQIDLSPGAKPEANEGIEYQIYGAAKIEWLAGTDKFLTIGATNDVLFATSGIDNIVTPSSLAIKPTNSYGVDDVNPIGRGSLLYYLQGDKSTMRSFEYSLEQDRYVPVNRNEISEHLTYEGISQFDYVEGSNDILWAVREDGKLVGMTTSSTESISGWHLHSTDGDFKSVCSQTRPHDDGQLWACVKRTINGVDRYNVEYMADTIVYPMREDFFTGDEAADKAAFARATYEAQKQYVYLDSAVTYDGSVFATQAVTPGATTGTGIVFTAAGSVFTADMVGSEIIRKSVTGYETGVALITAYSSPTSVTCTIVEAFNSVTAIPAGEWYITTNAVGGLMHLEGKTVSVVADGGQHPQVVVTGGVVTLERQASVFHIGLPYTGEVETNELEGGGTTGVSQTKPKSLYEVGLRFLNSMYVRYGTNRYRLNQIEARTANMQMDRPPLPFTGDIKVKYTNETVDARDGTWSKSKRVIFVQDVPFPCYIQLVVPYFTVSN